MARTPASKTTQVDEPDVGGRPPLVPSDEQRAMVQVMAGTLVPHATIARNIAGGISVNTLKKHFADELENGPQQLLASLKGSVVRAANNGSVRAQTWLLERLGGPEFAPRLRLSGEEGAAPIQISSESKVVVYLPDNGRGDGPKAEDGSKADDATPKKRARAKAKA